MTEMTPDCPHGEYTLVTGAQTSVLALQITVFGVKCTKCGKQWDMGDMMTAPARIEALEKAANEQAEDEGLWFHAATAPEAYLQKALRRLHALIEGDMLMAALAKEKP